MKLLAALGMTKASAAKADPLIAAIGIALLSSAAVPGHVLGDAALMGWLFVGSACGVCFTLFRDEKKVLTWRGVAAKLSLCFGPGFCLTGLGVILSGREATPELVLASSLVLSVGSPVLLPRLVDWVMKSLGLKVDES